MGAASTPSIIYPTVWKGLGTSWLQELTDEQWAVIEPHLPELPRCEDGRGRPWRESREVMNGILWILRSGAR
jgi:transposase